MNTNIIALTTATLLTMACGSEPSAGSTGGAGAGVMAAAGSSGSVAAQAGASAGGSMSSGGASGSSAGAGSLGGAGASGGSSGGEGGAGGVSASGGVAETGGASNGGGPSGGAGGAGGADSLSDIAKALDGMRVDDGCIAGITDTSVGAVCNHAKLTGAGFKGTQQAVLTGSAGTTYDVTLRIRGVVEPTAVTGGMRPDTSTFQYRSMTWRTTPYTIGGAVDQTTTDPDYTQWHIGVASPKGDFFLNDYQKTGHYIFKLDYQITIQVAANSTVILDGTDRNERQIVNYEKYKIDGIAESVNYGQFIQVNVVSVKLH